MANIKISELNEADLPLDGTEDIIVNQNAITKRCSTQDIADLATGVSYKIWRGLVSQTGTSAPTAIELENTLGGSITFTYVSTGVYTIEGTGLFTTDKTFATPKWETLRQSTNYATVTVTLANTNQLSLNSYLNGSAGDALLSKHPIEIIVYP